MRATLALAAALSLLPLAAGAEEKGPSPMLFDPGSVDTSPTGWSCTVDTLLSGVECVFESEAKPAADPAKQAEENAKRAAALAAKACAQLARPMGEAKADKDLLALCQRDFASAAGEGCDDEGKLPLLDEQGRFAATARPCYQALAEVVRRTRLMAAVSVKCCRCLMKNKCSKSVEQCNADFIRAQADEAAAACVDGACSDACASIISPPPSKGGPRRPATGLKEL